eukprot:scaffold73410_cov35-Tisochrysis_lutea.AAC.2
MIYLSVTTTTTTLPLATSSPRTAHLPVPVRLDAWLAIAILDTHRHAPLQNCPLRKYPTPPSITTPQHKIQGGEKKNLLIFSPRTAWHVALGRISVATPIPLPFPHFPPCGNSPRALLRGPGPAGFTGWAECACPQRCVHLYL